MSVERLVINDEGRSRHLPPLEAWKQPDKWIDLSAGTVREGIDKPKLPVDDRKFIIPDQAVRFMIDTYFWEDYDWPFDPDDVETRPDDHHFYYYRRNYVPSANQGFDTAAEFRGLPTSIGRMPRQLHNAIHSLVRPPLKPKRRDMAAYLDSYNLAVSAFQRSYHKVNELVRVGETRFDPSIFAGLPQTLDPIAEAFISGFFRHNFPSYNAAIDQFTQARQEDEAENTVFDQERVVAFAHTLGNVATQHYINFTPLLQAA